jgi:hypothetical protein
LEGAIWKVVRKCVPASIIRLEQLHHSWEEIATKRLAPHVWPVSIDGPALVLHVKDSNWLHELNYLKTDLRRRIRTIDPDIHALILRVASSGSTRAVAARADDAKRESARAARHAPQGMAPDASEKRAWLDEALSAIADNAREDGHSHEDVDAHEDGACDTDDAK